MTDYLSVRRARAAKAWNLHDELVLVGSGEPISIPGGADRTYPFISHSEYFYLTDRETPGGVLAFDPKEGWVDFVPAVTTAERVWEGRQDAPGTPLPQLAGWLAARRGRSIAMLGTPLPGLRHDAVRSEDLRDLLLHVRRPKDSIELDRMRRAAAATAAGFEIARTLIRPGLTERALQIEMEAEFFRHGADRPAYETIVAAGPDAAVLHFPPTERAIRPGDPVLIDAGAEVQRYASDITRTFRCPGGDPGLFADLYQLVLGVEEKAIGRCVAGAEWREVHLEAAYGIVHGLVEIGILRGRADLLLESDAHALFFPHGLGHLVGLGVRDAGGYAPGRPRSSRPGLSSLRVDLPLEAGYTITVEPGVYFIPALLQDPALRARHRDAVAWDRVDSLLDFGGIRIEDNVLVTTGAPEVLTAAVPKRLD